jgi:hypothetical protein
MQTKQNEAGKNEGTDSVVGQAHRLPQLRQAERLPYNSKKVFVSGELHPDIRVPFFVIPSGVEGSLAISACI